MGDISNRRIESRQKLTAFTPVYQLHPRLLLGYVGDLTLKGMLIIGNTPVMADRKTTLEVDFPGDRPDVSVIKVAIPARIAWCRPDENPEYYDIGVEFTDITSDQIDLLQQVLERYHFRHTFADDDMGSMT
jgi:hypothetical protein